MPRHWESLILISARISTYLYQLALSSTLVFALVVCDRRAPSSPLWDFPLQGFARQVTSCQPASSFDPDFFLSITNTQRLPSPHSSDLHFLLSAFSASHFCPVGFLSSFSSPPFLTNPCTFLFEEHSLSLLPFFMYFVKFSLLIYYFTLFSLFTIFFALTLHPLHPLPFCLYLPYTMFLILILKYLVLLNFTTNVKVSTNTCSFPYFLSSFSLTLPWCFPNFSVPGS